MGIRDTELKQLIVYVSKRNPVTGAEQSPMKLTLTKVDPNLTCEEVCNLISEKVQNKGYPEATPANRWSLYMPALAWMNEVQAAKELEEINLHGGNRIKVNNFEFKYLEMDQTLNNYLISDGYTLHYKPRRRPIPVEVFGDNGATKRLLIDDSWIVERIVEEIALIYDIPLASEWSLKMAGGGDEDDQEKGWLKRTLSLNEQEVDLGGTDGKPPLHFLLKKKLFFTDLDRDVIDKASISMLNFLYAQAKSSVLLGNFVLMDMQACVQLAALQLCIETDSPYDADKWRPGSLGDLSRYLPRTWSGERRIENDIFLAWKNRGHISRKSAMTTYIGTVRSHDYYGWAVWPITDKTNKRNAVRRFFGITSTEFAKFNFKTRDPIETKGIEEVFQCTPKLDTIEIMFGEPNSSADRPWKLQCESKEEADQIAQFFDDYWNALHRLREGKMKTSMGGNEATWDDDLEPVFFDPKITLKKKKKKKKGGKGEEADPYQTSGIAADVKSWPEAHHAIEQLSREFVPIQPNEVDSIPSDDPIAITKLQFQQKPKQEQANMAAERKGKVLQKAGEVNTVILDIVEYVYAQGPDSIDPQFVVARVAELKALQDELAPVVSSTLPTSNPKEGKRLKNGLADVSQATAGLLATLAGCVTDIGDEDNLADLLAASKEVASALSDLCGAAGVRKVAPTVAERIAKDFVNVEKATAILAEKNEAVVSYKGGKLFRSQAVMLKEGIAQLPVDAQKLKAVVATFGSNAGQADVGGAILTSSGLLLAKLDNIVAGLEDSTSDDLLKLAQDLAEALRGLQGDLLAAAAGPDYGADMEAISARVKMQLGNLHDADIATRLAIAKEISADASKAGTMAQEEAIYSSTNDSHALLIEAVKDMGGSTHTLQRAMALVEKSIGQGTEPSPRVEKALKKATKGVGDAVAYVMEMREYTMLFIEMAKKAQEVTLGTQAALKSYDPEVFQPPTIETTSSPAFAVMLTARSLHQAVANFSSEPGDPVNQEKLLKCVATAALEQGPIEYIRRIGTGKMSDEMMERYLEAQKATVEPSKWDLVQNAHRTAIEKQDTEKREETAKTLTEDLGELLEMHNKLLSNCWMHHVIGALKQCNNAIQDIHSTAEKARLEDKPRRDFDMDAMVEGEYYLIHAIESLVPNKARGFDTIEEITEGALTDAGHMAWMIKARLANEVATRIVPNAISLAKTTRDPLHGHALLSSSEQVVTDCASFINECADNAKRKEAPAEERRKAIDGVTAMLVSSLGRLLLAVPGIGDVDEALAHFRTLADELKLEDPDTDIPELQYDLLACAEALAAAIGSFSKRDDDLIEKKEVPEAVRQMSPMQRFYDETFTVCRAVNKEMRRLPTAAASPDELAEVVRLVHVVVVAVLDSVHKAIGQPELRSHKPAVMAALTAIAEGVIESLEHVRVLARDGEDPSAQDGLKKSTLKVEDANFMLMKALKAANANDSSEGNLDKAQQAIEKELPRLDPSNLEPPKNMPIKDLQDGIVRAVASLNPLMGDLATFAVQSPEMAGNAALNVSAKTTTLINCACAAASIVKDRPADEETKVEPVPVSIHENIAPAISKSSGALTALLRAAGGNDEATYKVGMRRLAAAIVSLKKDVAEASKLLAPEDAKILDEASGKVVSHGVSFMKSHGHLGSDIKHDAKTLSHDIVYLDRAAKKLTYMHVPQQNGPMHEALINGSRTVASGMLEIIGVAKLLVGDGSDDKIQRLIQSLLDKHKKTLKELGDVARLLTPGQRECEWAHGQAVANYKELNSAILDFAAKDRLVFAKATQKADHYFDELINNLELLDAAVVSLKEAAVTSAKDMVPAATGLGHCLDPITFNAKALAAASADTKLARAILNRAAAVPAEAADFIHTCAEAGGSALKEKQVMNSAERVSGAMSAISALLRADEANREECDLAAQKIVDSIRDLSVPVNELQVLPNKAYKDYSDDVRAKLEPLSQAIVALNGVAEGRGEYADDVGAAAKAVAALFPPLMGALSGCMVLGGDDLRGDLLDAARNLAWSMRAMIGAAQEANNDDNDDSSLVGDSNLKVSDALSRLVDVTASGSSNARTCEGATKSIARAVDHVATPEFLIKTHRLPPAPEGATWDSKVTELEKGLEDVRAEIKKIAGSKSPEELGDVSSTAATKMGALLKLTEAGLPLLEFDDDQLSLLAAAKNLAAAMSGLISGTHDALKNSEAADPVLVDTMAVACDIYNETLGQSGESGARVDALFQQIREKIAAAPEGLSAPASGRATPEQIAEAAKLLLRAAQGLRFAMTKGKKQVAAAASDLPGDVTAIILSFVGASSRIPPEGREKGEAEVRRVVQAVLVLLDAVVAEKEKNEITALSQAITGLLAYVRAMDTPAADIDAKAEFANAIADASADLKQYQTAVIGVKNTNHNPNQEGFYNAVLSNSATVFTGGLAFLEHFTAAVEEKGLGNTPDAYSPLLTAIRNVHAAVGELSAAVQALAKREADENHVLRAAQGAVAPALKKAVVLALSQSGSSVQSQLKHETGTVAKACQEIIDACKARPKAQAAAKTASKAAAGGVGGNSGGGPAADGPSDGVDYAVGLQKRVEERVKLMQLEHELRRAENVVNNYNTGEESD